MATPQLRWVHNESYIDSAYLFVCGVVDIVDVVATLPSGFPIPQKGKIFFLNMRRAHIPKLNRIIHKHMKQRSANWLKKRWKVSREKNVERKAENEIRVSEYVCWYLRMGIIGLYLLTFTKSIHEWNYLVVDDILVAIHPFARLWLIRSMCLYSVSLSICDPNNKNKFVFLFSSVAMRERGDDG